MVTLSAFADEISPSLEAAVRVLKGVGLASLDLRGFDGTNVMKFTDEQVAGAKKLLKREKMAVASIATPIGKVQVTDAFEPQAGQMKRALELAATFGCPTVRVFSFYVTRGEDPKKWRKEVLDRMGRLVKQAEGTGVTVVLENEEGLYGDTIERCADIINALKAKQLKLAFDPCNLVIIGPKPFTDSFSLATKHLGYLHVKDWVRERKEMVPAGFGDAEWPQIAAGLKKIGYAGVVALEPHLSAAGQFSGFSGPDLFKKAHEALVGVLKTAGIDYT